MSPVERIRSGMSGRESSISKDGIVCVCGTAKVVAVETKREEKGIELIEI